jgi:hypothetical protein
VKAPRSSAIRAFVRARATIVIEGGSIISTKAPFAIVRVTMVPTKGPAAIQDATVVSTKGSIVIEGGRIVLTKGPVVILRGAIVSTEGPVTIQDATVVSTKGSLSFRGGTFVRTKATIVNHRSPVVMTIVEIVNEKGEVVEEGAAFRTSVRAARGQGGPVYSADSMVGRPKVGASLLALLAGVAIPSLLHSARADEAAWSLVWEAPAGCPSEANVRDAVAQLLGTGGPPPASVSARAVVQRTSSDHWIVQLTTVREGARGERVVEATSCPSLASATALIVALTIDPERVAANSPPSGAASSTLPSATPVSTAAASTVAPLPSASASTPPPAPPPPSSSAVPAPVPRAVSSPPPARAPAPARDEGPRRFALLLEGMGDVGSLPSVSDGISASLAVTFDALRLEVFGSHLFAQPFYAASLPSIGSNLDLWSGGLRGCYLPDQGVLALGACAGLEAGQLQGNGFGSLRGPYQTFTPASQGGLWIAPVAGGRLAWRIAPYFSLVIDLGIAVPLQRDTFDIDGASGATHQASPVVARGAAGPELRF